jgi:uncharacterized YigZ family protein
MSEEDFYYTIEKHGSAEFKDRGSKFIAFAFPAKSVDECKERLNEIKKGHPKATHHCFAYRVGRTGDNFRASDDGEPSGTAGRPILGQIDSKSLVNIIVIVVRYFGGTLLGVAGLINAYKSAAALVIQTTPLVQKMIEAEFIIRFDYTQINDIMRVVKQFNCRIIEQEMQLFCSMRIAVSKNRTDEVKYTLNELRDVEVVRA